MLMLLSLVSDTVFELTNYCREQWAIFLELSIIFDSLQRSVAKLNTYIIWTII